MMSRFFTLRHGALALASIGLFLAGCSETRTTTAKPQVVLDAIAARCANDEKLRETEYKSATSMVLWKDCEINAAEGTAVFKRTVHDSILERCHCYVWVTAVDGHTQIVCKAFPCPSPIAHATSFGHATDASSPPVNKATAEEIIALLPESAR
jgi:hypothetical protein